MKRPALLAASTAALLLLAGCAATTEGAESDGGRFVYASDLEPVCFDTGAYKNLANYNVVRQIVDPLVRQTPAGDYAPGLASAWSSSDDGLVWTFTLDDGITFHDGEVLSAEAVEASFARFSAEGTTLSAPRWYASSRVVDDTTWELTLARPTANILQSLSTPDYPILSAGSLERYTDGDRCGDPTTLVGTGPFIPVDYQQGASLLLERNDDYEWGPEWAEHSGPAYLAEVELRFVPESQVRLGSLTSGDVDAVASVPPVNAEELEAAGLEIVSAPATGVPFVAPLNTAAGPTAELAVRQALQVGIDVESIVQNVYAGRYERAYTPLAPTTAPAGSYDDSLESSVAYDPEAAAALLDGAGWTGTDADGFRTRDGDRLTLRWILDAGDIRDQRDVVVEAIQAQARDLGIEIVIEQLDSAAYSDRGGSGDYEVLSESWGQSDAAVFGFAVNPNGIAPNGINYSRYVDDELGSWVVEAAGSADPARRAELYRAAQQRVAEQATILPIYVQSFLVASAPGVSGIAFDNVGYPTSFHDVQVAD